MAARCLAGNATFIQDAGWLLAYCHRAMGDIQMASHWAQLALIAPKQTVRTGNRSHTWEHGCQALLQSIHCPMGTLEGDEPPPSTLKEGHA